ncbi:MAG: prolipoprotein diacylglyceryl transferase [Ruminococcaceae bacterium]|nr:prolipoprotein diacylglyceryl transferase [Oscillospiraceae bacterium]
MILSKTTVSFPGIGIENFELDNVAFSIGDNFQVYWYGVIITLGIVLAFIYASFRAKYEKILVDDLIDVALWTVVLGVIGARLYYVLTTLENYIPEPFNLWEFLKNVFNLREGGLAIYGGIICGILGIVIATKIKKVNTIKLMDMAGPGVMIAQSLGRWGNFFNGEAHGGIVAQDSPLYFIRMGLLPNEDSAHTMFYYHPTFLYESLWNLLGFILINIFYKKKKFNGQIACMYLAWYGFGRFFIEALRTDSLYIPGTAIRISQLVGILCFVVFGALLVAGLIYSRKFKDPDAKLTKFDEMIKPSLELNPVFFAKKEKVADGVENSNEAEEEKQEQEQEQGEEEDGTDN